MANDLNRPNPDELLARVQQEEQQRHRGKLKIFLGYVAGVGKTFAMLEAAHQRKAEGEAAGDIEEIRQPEHHVAGNFQQLSVQKPAFTYNLIYAPGVSLRVFLSLVCVRGMHAARTTRSPAQGSAVFIGRYGSHSANHSFKATGRSLISRCAR